MTKKKTPPTKRAVDISKDADSNPELIGAFQNRIQGLRYVSVSELRGHPKNWRVHPPDQTTLLNKLFREVGVADALKVRELPEGGYQILDGHLRAGIIGDTGTVPVIVLNVTESESEKLLASYDPVSLMAEADTEKLKELMRVDLFEDAGIKEMLESILLGESELDRFDVSRPVPEKKESSIVSPPPQMYRISVFADTKDERDTIVSLLTANEYTPEVKEINQWDSGT